MGLFWPNIDKLKAKGRIGKLIKALEHKESSVRLDAANALGELGDTRAVEPLIAALNDKEVDVRKAATNALGQIGDIRAVEPIADRLKDNDFFVKKKAIWALGQIEGPESVKLLISTLSDDKSYMREFAANALDLSGWSPDKSEAGAAYWVARLQWKRCIEIGTLAVAPLIKALKDHRQEIRKGAADSLYKLGWQPNKDETAVLYWAAKLRWDQCVELGSIAVEPLISALSDKDKYVREGAAGALGKIGDAQAVNYLIVNLKDPWRQVRKAAANALITIYTNYRLDQESKLKILEMRSIMAEKHCDNNIQTSDCTHHNDTGIGISFPG